MLRITQTIVDRSVLLCRVEGKLLRPYLGELRVACQKRPVGATVRLDLTSVSYVDAAGEALLRELLQSGVTIASCSGYVAELLHLGMS